MQGARVRPLVRELDPARMLQLRVRMPQLRPGAAKINKYLKIIIISYSKVAGYKVNIQKSIAFLYTSNELLEFEI